MLRAASIKKVSIIKKKSNLFQLSEKYPFIPIPIILIIASPAKMYLTTWSKRNTSSDDSISIPPSYRNNETMLKITQTKINISNHMLTAILLNFKYLLQTILNLIQQYK